MRDGRGSTPNGTTKVASLRRTLPRGVIRVRIAVIWIVIMASLLTLGWAQARWHSQVLRSAHTGSTSRSELSHARFRIAESAALKMVEAETAVLSMVAIIRCMIRTMQPLRLTAQARPPACHLVFGSMWKNMCATEPRLDRAHVDPHTGAAGTTSRMEQSAGGRAPQCGRLRPSETDIRWIPCCR